MDKTTKIIISIVIVIAIAWLGYASFKNQQAANQSIKIGAMYALSGPAAKFGEISIHGVRDAISYFKEKNPGVNVELFAEDTRGDPKQGVSAATKLFDVDKIKFSVMGLSSVSAAVAPIADQYGSLVISDAALYGLTKNRQYMFQNFMPSLNDVSNQININEDWNRIAIVYVNDEFGTTWSQKIKAGIFSDKISNKVIQTFSFETKTTDYRTEALKIRQFKPDVIVVLGYGPALNQVLADISLQKIPNVAFISYLACTLPGVITDKRFDLNGQYSYEYPSISDPSIKEWITKNGGSNSTFYTVAFENTLIVLSAAKAANSNSKDAIGYLKNQTVNGLYGLVKFGQDGVVNRDLILTKIENNQCSPVSQ